MHAALLQIQGTLLEMLAAMQTLGHQLRVISNNSIARVNNGHAQQGNSALAPIEIEAPEHVSSQSQRPSSLLPLHARQR